MATRDLTTQYLRLRSAMHRKRGPEAMEGGSGSATDTARIGMDGAQQDWGNNMVSGGKAPLAARR